MTGFGVLNDVSRWLWFLLNTPFSRRELDVNSWRDQPDIVVCQDVPNPGCVIRLDIADYTSAVPAYKVPVCSRNELRHAESLQVVINVLTCQYNVFAAHCCTRVCLINTNEVTILGEITDLHRAPISRIDGYIAGFVVKVECVGDRIKLILGSRARLRHLIGRPNFHIVLYA